MKTKTRILIAVAAILLVFAYLFPIWNISLEAPQYPEGLGLYIRINTIEGHRQNDLHSLNKLNHYIGMKSIEPESIPELKIMPYIMLFMILTGLLVAVFKKKITGWIWIGLFIIISFAGLYDFYMWEYDYGHNLDPLAVIKIPGMSYQPPLIGTQQLLNITATSMPSIGGYAVFISILLVVFALFFDKHLKVKE